MTPAKLAAIAESAGLAIAYVRTVRRRGWPTPSARPVHVYRPGEAKPLGCYSNVATAAAAIRRRFPNLESK